MHVPPDVATEVATVPVAATYTDFDTNGDAATQVIAPNKGPPKVPIKGVL